MIRIAICDDSQKDREIITRELARYLGERNLTGSVTVDVFSHPDALLDASDRFYYDLFLLDILMPMVNGISAAKEISAHAGASQFIFISTTSEFVTDAFVVNPTYYLLKPVKPEQMDVALDRAFARMSADEERLVLRGNAKTVHSFLISEILYLEARGKKVRVVTADREEWLSCSMIQAAEKFSSFPSMVKCGASFTVNLANVRSCGSDEIVMRNGDVIPVPRRSSKELRAAYLSYFNTEGRE